LQKPTAAAKTSALAKTTAAATSTTTTTKNNNRYEIRYPKKSRFQKNGKATSYQQKDQPKNNNN
jgi:hypothetical protein